MTSILSYRLSKAYPCPHSEAKNHILDGLASLALDFLQTLLRERHNLATEANIIKRRPADTPRFSHGEEAGLPFGAWGRGRAGDVR